jgi:NADPH:quinone reductase-like Zn-dependent oxidoreductase
MMSIEVEIMSWQHIRIARFGGPEVLELAEEPRVPEPGPGEVRTNLEAAVRTLE